MKIADFFISLGLQGTNSAQTGLNGIKGTLGDMKISALAAKAGVLGVVYSMERLSMNSSKTGADLVSFAASTGYSIDKLQQWQYAAKLANLSAEEIQGSITGIQQAMLQMQTTGSMPAGFARVMSQVNIDPSRLREQMYVFEKIAEYLKTTKDPIDLQNELVGSLHYSANLAGRVRNGNFDEKILNAAPRYSEGQAKALDSVNAGWQRLYMNFEKGFGDITAKFGPAMIRDLGNVSKEILKAIAAFSQMADKIHLMKGVGMVFEGWGEIFKLVTLGAQALNATADRFATQSGEEDTRNWWDKYIAPGDTMTKEQRAFTTMLQEKINSGFKLSNGLSSLGSGYAALQGPIARRQQPVQHLTTMNNYIEANNSADVVNHIEEQSRRVNTRVGKRAASQRERN